MTSTDRLNVPIGKAAAGLIVIAGFIAQYYTTQSAVKDGFNEFKRETDLKIRDLENEDKMLKRDIGTIDRRVDNMERGITSYLGKAILPNEPKLEENKRR